MTEEIKEFELNGKKYRVIDFDKEATIRMEEVASELFSDSLTHVLTQNQKFSLDGFMKGLVKSNNMRKGMALICWEKDETKFDLERYNKRIEEFLDIPQGIRRQLTPKVSLFFDGIGDSLTGDFLIFNGLMQKVAPKNIEKQ